MGIDSETNLLNDKFSKFISNYSRNSNNAIIVIYQFNDTKFLKELQKLLQKTKVEYEIESMINES